MKDFEEGTGELIAPQATTLSLSLLLLVLRALNSGPSRLRYDQLQASLLFLFEAENLFTGILLLFLLLGAGARSLFPCCCPYIYSYCARKFNFMIFKALLILVMYQDSDS